MTIDKEQLISLLIDKTGLEPDQVESQLSELINRIQQAAKEGKTFEVEGFGVFSMKDGNLQFEPHNMLETEINNKYAGMKPIELIGAFKEPQGDEVPEIPEGMPEEIDNKWAFDESAMEEGAAVTPEASEAEEGEEEKEELIGQQDSESETASEENDFEKVFGTKQEEESRDPLQEKLAAKQEKAEPVDESEEETDTLGTILVAAVVIIALGVGGWFIYDIGFAGNDTWTQFSQETTRQSSVPVRQTGDTQQDTPPQTSVGDKSSEPEQEMKVINPQGSSEKVEVQQQSKFGLRGSVNKSAGGYTIVVHSLRSMQKAENNRQELEDEGYRALITKAEVSGTTYYRVGIGQFESVSDAQQAMSELAPRYRENNFIKRIP